MFQLAPDFCPQNSLSFCYASTASAPSTATPAPSLAVAPSALPTGKRCSKCGRSFKWTWCEPCRAKDNATDARIARKFARTPTRAMF